MIKTFTAEDFTQLAGKASNTERRRAHLNVHESHDANVQRLFIATEPDTYIRPHRHREAHKWEFFMVLTGEIDLLIFDDQGNLKQRIVMAPDQTRAIELPPNTWHSYVCKKPGTVALEVKEGAYLPTQEGDFAPWAPAENTAEVATFLQWMREARPV
ncbi:WbuC family cupin fold metalloprotein [Kaarinaea lacus]